MRPGRRLGFHSPAHLGQIRSVDLPKGSGLFGRPARRAGSVAPRDDLRQEASNGYVQKARFSDALP
jgi:hypothetical protein